MNKSNNVDEYIAKQPQWQQNNLKLFRDAINDLSRNIKEDIKWNVPVFLLDGKLLFAMSTFKAHTKYNFLNGAELENQTPFNNGLDSKKSRAIDIRKGESPDINQLKLAVNEAISKHKGV